MYRILLDQNLFRTQCLINGRWRDAADKSVIEVVNPANGKLLGTVPNCGQAETHEARLLGAIDAPRPVLFRPCGCERCDFQGYRGRLAIMEILRMNGDLDELVARRGTARELLKAASQTGFVPLADDGLRRVLDGSTSLEELARVVNLTDRM